MKSLNKIICVKKVLGSFFVASIFIIIASDAHARFMKKLVVEPLSNPKEWQKPFKPGVIFTSILEKSLSNSGQFQLVKLDKEVTKTTALNVRNNLKAFEREKTKVVKDEKLSRVDSSEPGSSIILPSSQYKVRGNISIFAPDTNPLKEGRTGKGVLRHKERAMVTAVIELVHLRTGRLLAKKSFSVISEEGRIPFDNNITNIEYENIRFKSSSIGKALWSLNNKVEAFIIKILDDVPLEGDLILVDLENKKVMINLGKANGIVVQDVFTIFSMKNGFNDPLNKIDLGDKYTRKGVIKIVEVQGRFSRAQIMAGLELVPGDLVVPKVKKSRKHGAKDTAPEKDIIWGSYKGLSSLSY